MSIFNEARSHDPGGESPESRRPVARASDLHNIATEAITLPSQSTRSDDRSAIMLTLLVLAREMANSAGLEVVRPETLQELDRSIANLTDVCRAARYESPKVQTAGANVGFLPSPAVVGIAARSLMLGSIGEKLCDIAGRIDRDSAVATNSNDRAAQCNSNGAIMASTSPLMGVISYSSSLNECWFW